MNVRPATADEVEVAGEIIDEATQYVAALGYEQWTLPFPREELADRAERGELYLVEVDGQAAATVTLLWEDTAYWGERPPDAVYVHKLAVRREFAGRGLGAAVVDWAARQAAAAGRECVRLDCLRDSPRIRSYYEALGFEHRGEHDIGRFSVALYERPAAP